MSKPQSMGRSPQISPRQWPAGFRSELAWSTILLLCLSAHARAPLDSALAWVNRDVVLLPDYKLTMDVSTFALHKDAFFKRQYLAEPNANLEFDFLGISNMVYSVWHADFDFGLGEIPGNTVFTVLNVAFGITPAIEVRLPKLAVGGGMEHRCFHEVDRLEYPLVYWNTVFLYVNSPNIRGGDYWTALAQPDGWTQRNRLAWSSRVDYYLKELGGLADPHKLNGNNSREWEASTTCRYAFYRRHSWIVNAQGASMAGIRDRDPGETGLHFYWRQEAGFEAYFRRGVKGAAFYMKYILDDLPLVGGVPRFSKDRLLQIGVRFFS
jgi:hypothetical protein